MSFSLELHLLFSSNVLPLFYEHCHYYSKKGASRQEKNEELPQLKLVPSKATYLLWIDCRKLGGQLKELPDIIRKTSGLYLSGGNQYGADGYNFLRMNIACPRSILNDGLERLKKGILAYESQH